MDHIKITEKDGMLGLVVSFFAAPETAQMMVHIMSIYGVILFIGICWQNPIIISYKDKKFSIRSGWDVL